MTWLPRMQLRDLEFTKANATQQLERAACHVLGAHPVFGSSRQAAKLGDLLNPGKLMHCELYLDVESCQGMPRCYVCRPNYRDWHEVAGVTCCSLMLTVWARQQLLLPSAATEGSWEKGLFGAGARASMLDCMAWHRNQELATRLRWGGVGVSWADAQCQQEWLTGGTLWHLLWQGMGGGTLAGWQEYSRRTSLSGAEAQWTLCWLCTSPASGKVLYSTFATPRAGSGDGAWVLRPIGLGSERVHQARLTPEQW